MTTSGETIVNTDIYVSPGHLVEQTFRTVQPNGTKCVWIVI